MEWNVSLHQFIWFSNSRPLTFKSAHSAFSHSMSRLSRWNLMKGEVFVCQYFERHSTFRFDIEFPLQTFLECSLLKGQVFEKTRERHFSKWHFGDHSSSWTHAPNPKNVKSDNTAEIYIGRASYLSCKLGGFDFLVGLIRDRCSRNVQDKKWTSV